MQKSKAIELIGDDLSIEPIGGEIPSLTEQIGSADRKRLVEISADDLRQIAGGLGVDGTHN